MNFKIGDFVTRQSYNNDIVFKIINIVDGIAYLKGNYIRLYADSPVSDLNMHKEKEIDTFAEKIEEEWQSKISEYEALADEKKLEEIAKRIANANGGLDFFTKIPLPKSI